MDNEKQIIRAEYSDIMQKSYIDYAPVRCRMCGTA